MQVSEIIAKKRDGKELAPVELEFLLMGYLNGEIKDYQMSAWLMAVYFKGMTDNEMFLWTRLMWKSGMSFPRKDKTEFWIDKHSTGGVGDKTSLILVPLVHAVSEKLLGKGKVKIPMISGRGLGHSGGTLDKLDSVPGFTSQLDIETALRLLSQQGFFMLGQTEKIAPADRLIYALRDVTATVESNALIVSSILSKKLAESPDGLVFDVKAGSGAFMQTKESALHLSSLLVNAAKKENVDAVALISRMDEPLGRKIGNALEIEECAAFFKGDQEKGMQEVVFELSTLMVFLASNRRLDCGKIRSLCEELSTDPLVFKLYQQMFQSQGGNWEAFLDRARAEKEKLLCFDWKAKSDGWISASEAKSFGMLLIALKGGRQSKEDKVDPYVGFELIKKCGDAVKKNDTILRVYHRKKSETQMIEEKLSTAITIAPNKIQAPEWVIKKVL